MRISDWSSDVCSSDLTHGILQPLSERKITLAAQDHMGTLEARTGEPEVVHPVNEPDPGDVYAQIGHVGKIRQPHPTRLVHLAEDHVATRALQRPQATNPTPHRPRPPIGTLRMTKLHFIQPRHRPAPRRRLPPPSPP